MSAQIQLPIAQHNPEDLVFISQTNQIATDSFLVAKFFGKQHKHVLEKVRSIDCSKEFAESNFWLCHKNNELQNNKLQPFYQMTKDGFLFLVMEITGFARSTLYSIEKYNPDFPKRVRIGVKAVGWMKHEVEEWVQKRPYIA